MKRLFALAVLLLAAGPASAQLAVVGELLFAHDVPPGTRAVGTVEVLNSTDEPQEGRAYLSDYRYTADGKHYYEETGALPRSGAPFITFSPERFTIPPRRALLVEYTIDVPADADTLDGSYWSVLMIEGIDASSTAGGGGVGFVQRIRYAVQLVAETGRARGSVAFERVDLAERAGEPVLEVDLANDGNRYLRPEITVEFYDDAGGLAATRTAETQNLLPGSSVRYRVPIAGVEPGVYQVVVVVDAGGDDVFGAQYSLTL